MYESYVLIKYSSLTVFPGGGIGWTGPTVCVAGASCSTQNSCKYNGSCNLNSLKTRSKNYTES